MALPMILLATAVAAIALGYIFFVRIRLREKSDAANRNEKNADRGGKHRGGVAGNQNRPVNENAAEQQQATAASGGGGRAGRKTAAASVTTNVKKQRTAEANYQHPWLYTTLKGHTGQVFDMDFSRNGKYLATCAEDSPSARLRSGNHLINGNINGNDVQNTTTTRSLSPASSSSSSSAFSGVSDGKILLVTGQSNDANCGTNSSGTNSSSSSSSSSTRGEDSPNAQNTANKKQRKYTKKKQQYKRTNNNNGTNNSHHKSSATLQVPPAAAVQMSAEGDDDSTLLQEPHHHITHTQYFYNSTSSPLTSSKVAASSSDGSVKKTQRASIDSTSSSSSSSSSLLSSSSSSSSSSVKNGKNSSYQGRQDLSGSSNVSARVVEANGGKKYHQANATSSKAETASEGAGGGGSISTTTPLRQYVKLNLCENELVKYLRRYVLDKDVMKQLGFPVEYGLDTEKAIIFKLPNDFYRTAATSTASSTAKKCPLESNLAVSADKSDDNDSGQGSGTSSPTNVDDNDALLMYRMATQPGGSTSLTSPLSDAQLQPSEERECCRCGKGFFLTLDGEYLTQEHCIYHWGRLISVYSGSDFKKMYSCCNGDSDVKGCTINKLHVWTGLLSGFNGPYDGFVKTKPSPRKQKKFQKLLRNKFCYDDISMDFSLMLQDDLLMDDDENDGVFALDCEMSYTGRGLELTKVTVVSADGSLKYEKLVKPDIEIVDYNTRFSGVTEADFADPGSYVTLKQVQKDLLKFIFDDTILIGHSIDNDLKVLKIIHKTVIDTSITFPHMNGFPFRQSLKSLTKNILKRDIQIQGGQQPGSAVMQPLHSCTELVCGVNCNSSSSSSNNSSNCKSSTSNSNEKGSRGSGKISNSFGHCSLEDSRASLELMLWRVRKDKAVYDNIWSNNFNCYRVQNN
ncbi:RNA exonuclease 1 homolog isoform X2 [Uranotaenia lowii]|uniref:RNA exonuclease 1 homolog isoform X2 n=1 Tax=Uranotaenia lowii TaxID=190385 RepID=UPI00247878B4|nr:RNA exonuclease 1 homolog isoform X2 [Uranotaenia lowii]